MRSRPDTDDYLSLFLSDTPLLDTRAPVEFARGAMPGAVNLPLMDDSERGRVGTCYKREGQEAAIALGHSLVSGEIRARRVEAWKQFAEQHPDGYLYCFRGGMRSAICQQWLAGAGVHYPRVAGGYKAMRRFLLDSLETICQTHPLVILAGHTGSAKTVLLEQLPGSVDLEGLAHHRGSAFGKRVRAQPAQIDFENAVAVALLRLHHRQPDRPIVLEDESRLIGRCALPLALREAMERAPVVVRNVPLASRVTHSFDNYILDKLREWQEALGTEQGFSRFAEDLRDSLYRVRRRLGGERHQQLREMLESALDRHVRENDPSLHREWIEALLRDYYDPMYEYQMSLKQDRVIFRGDGDQMREFLQQYRPGMGN